MQTASELARMNGKRSLIASLIFSVVLGTVAAYLKSHGILEPSWWCAFFVIVAGAVVFDWYYRDSKARSFARPRWLNIAVAAAPLLAIPYYLVLLEGLLNPVSDGAR